MTLQNKVLKIREANDFSHFDSALKKLSTFIDSKVYKAAPKLSQQNDKKPKVKYTKEDLISFHELFLSKPLVKACNWLEFDHPTSI